MKRTVFVVYTTKSVAETGYMKRYTFNVEGEVKVGDLLKSASYESPMRVVEILDTSFLYFNRVTGELSDTLKNSNSFKIRDLKIVTDNYETIIARKIEE